ncbi:PrsW family intramembrane metalloprotease [Saccharopolyspora flava]|uniref:Membrane proteinase PrsW, cleaves anti-sigma factor RsiW, M82 family n=1 Tax=Saccharopolyspora flava TaxID=95161 RepID=A0A1I6QXK1_9PSEU|nr:PrsW family intramembrane metalloprotease [Saccharopolyspora flava]SFS57132.1 Membrane proteinase PrsW, cleaves anti-sigma factor RsiW, M82 family [Saccharopolyspora flava]
MSSHDPAGPVADVSRARRLQSRKHHAVGWPIAGLILLGMIGLIMLGITTSRVGAGPAVFGAVAALLPVGVVVAATVWIDRWEPEPPMLMVGAFLWGAGGATACSLLLNNTSQSVANLVMGQTDHRFFLTAVMGPVVEEFAKAVFVAGLWMRRRAEFNGLVDGIVYASLTAAGFAFTENILYFGKAFADGGVTGGAVVALFVLRGVLAPFSHPLFTSMFGIAVGFAWGARTRLQQVGWLFGGYLVAVLLHAVWNSATFLGGTGFINVYFLIMVPVFLGTFALIIWQRKREQRIVIEQLPKLERAGLIARSEMDLLASLTGRQGWLSKVKKRAGAQAAKSVRDYQIAVTELAFLQHRSEAGRTTSAARRARRDKLIADLKQARRSAAGRQEAIQTAKINIDVLTSRVPKPRE